MNSLTLRWKFAVGLIVLLMLVAAQGCAPAKRPTPTNAKAEKETETAAVCPKCGQPLPQNAGHEPHKCQSAPLSKAELERRKAAAHALSRGQDSEFHLRSNAASAESRPPEWREYIKDDAAAIALGKALFWDMRVGSDDRTACATCHHHAGVDSRTRNTAFAYRSEDFVTNTDKTKSLANHEWTKVDHVQDDDTKDSKKFGLIVGESTLVIGSQGVRHRRFNVKSFEEAYAKLKQETPQNFSTNTLKETGSEEVNKPAPEFPGNGDQGKVYRQVTNRNSPTVINAGMLSRLFHDGRAADVFNGYDVFGADSPYTDDLGKYRVRNGRIERVEIKISMAAAASQAVGPPVSDVEMSYAGRQFEHIAMKLLDSTPLLTQDVSVTDSVLSKYLKPPVGQATVKGLSGTTYRDLIKAAFHEGWWQAPAGQSLPDPAAKRNVSDLMVANFSMYFGLAIMAYEQTLVSDDAPFDRFMRGESLAMTPEAHRGFERFIVHGCADCHLMPEFAGATLAAIFGGGKEEVTDEYEAEPSAPRPLPKPLNPDGTAFVEEMLFENPEPRFRAYDNGFYNIGVTGLKNIRKDVPWDLGIGIKVKIEAASSIAPTKSASPSPSLARSIEANFNAQGNKSLRLKLNRAMVPSDQNFADDPPDGSVAPQTPNDLVETHADPAKSKENRRFVISKSLRLFPNQSPRKNNQSAVKGAFKTPSLRNIQLTAPYMHNGAFLTLKEVIRFYRYGPRKFDADPEAPFFHHPELKAVQISLKGEGLNEEGVEKSENDMDAELIAFLRALTDDRAKYHKAPFDHPSLLLPSGNRVNAVGNENNLDDLTELPATGQGLTEAQLEQLDNWSKLQK